MATAAIWYESDGYRLEGRPLMGRRVAGQEFLKAFARFARTDRFTAVVRNRQNQGEFVATMRELRPEIPASAVTPDAMGKIADVGCLYYPGPLPNELSWMRRYFAPRTWSLCGVTHTVSSLRGMKIVADWPLAGFEPWDAMVCTSSAVKDAVERILGARIAQFREQLGATRVSLPRLPIIPLGVDCDRQAEIMRGRDAARASLGIAEDEFVVLFVGRLAFNAKAHPFPMYLALQRLAAHHKVVLVECGWTDNDVVGRVFKEARTKICPSVRSIVLDGTSATELARGWACADCFCSLSDNIQESFGLTPIEAMASGLPCIVTDWDGYRDTVRDGLDGFRVATLAPPPRSAADLIFEHVFDMRPYGGFIGHVAAMTAVDCEATTAAFERVAGNPELRRELGANGARRAREAFDWSVVIRAYETLWEELAEIRTAALKQHPVQAKPVRWAEHLDPFDLFASYPTAALQPKMRIRLLPDAETDAFEERLSLAMAMNEVMRGDPIPALKQLRDRLRTGPCEVEAFLGHYRPNDRTRALRGLMLMAKFGLVAIDKP
jgi:alpha-maltose-1-phosphate synthase